MSWKYTGNLLEICLLGFVDTLLYFFAIQWQKCIAGDTMISL